MKALVSVCTISVLALSTQAFASKEQTIDEFSEGDCVILRHYKPSDEGYENMKAMEKAVGATPKNTLKKDDKLILKVESKKDYSVWTEIISGPCFRWEDGSGYYKGDKLWLRPRHSVVYYIGSC